MQGEQEPSRHFAGKLFERLSFIIPERRNTPGQFVFAAGLMMFALAMRLLIAPVEGGIQYVTFFPAVAITAVVGGLWPGLFAALLGTVFATYLFWPPYMALTFEFSRQTVSSNLVFMVDAVLVCTSIEAMHRFYRRFVDAERELRLAASVFHNSSEGVVITAPDGIIVSVNPAFSTITGYEADEVVGRRPSILRSNRHDEAFYRALWDSLERTGCWQGEIWNRRKNGEAYLEWLAIDRVDGRDGKPVRYVGVFRDMTELHDRHDHMRRLAFHDALTGLPNRLLLQDRLAHAIELARREGRRVAIAFVDLDRFKAINDSLGHDIGDLLLQEVSRRIVGRLRASDTAVRLGGDEFVILMEDQDAGDDGAVLANELLAAISAPMQLSGHAVQVGASIGIAFFPEDGQDPGDLLKHADMAMYAAKSSGRNTFRHFRREVDAQ